MEDENKTREQLIDELAKLRSRVADLEASEVKHKQTAENEERYRRIVENTLDVIYTCSPDGTITYLSPRVRSMGFSSEEVVGRNLTEFIHPDDVDRVLGDFQKTMQTGEEFPTAFRLVNPSGQIIHVEETGKVIKDRGEVISITGAIRDIGGREGAWARLREGEERYRNIYENSPIAIEIYDADGRLLHLNKACLDLFGISCISEITGFSLLDDPNMPDEVREKLRNGETVRFEAPFDFGKVRESELYETTRAGLIYLDVLITPLHSENKETLSGYLVQIQDITERRQAEKELREYQDHLEELVRERTARLTETNDELQREILERKRMVEAVEISARQWQTTFDGISDAIFLLDDEGKVLQCNKAAQDLLGKTVREVVGCTCYELMHGELQLPDMCPIVRTLETHRRESNFWQMDGRWYNVTADPLLDDSGNLIGIVHIISDVTEQKQSEEDLRKSEEKLRSLFEILPVGFCIVNKERKIIDANPALEKILDISREDLHHGKHFDREYLRHDGTVMPIEEFPGVLALEEQRIVQNTELGIVKEDGDTVWINVSAIPVAFPDWSVVIAVSDITEHRRMEEELLRSQKLESVGILAGGIAHDFNNILTAILGNMSLAKMYLVNQKETDKAIERLAEAERASVQARELTQQLLTFSKGGMPVKSTGNVGDLLRESAIFASRGSNIRCEFSIPEDLWPVEFDEGQINQVINNLIINADQAMPEGGLVKIRAENINLGMKRILPLKPGAHVKISIEDQGTGIPEDSIQKIFDPYYTTKQKNSGLGLATVYSIIRKHDGYISVESRLGVGATFNIYLPTSQKEAVPHEKRAEEELNIGESRILVMDDEKYIRDLAAEMLSSAGCKVITSIDGAEAIEIYKAAMESGQPFDAVIVDLTVPGGMGGKDAVQRLIEIDPQIKAIVSSGYSNDPVMAEFRKYGFKGVIAKPYQLEELNRVLRRVIADANE